MIFDTSFMIDILRGNHVAIKKLMELEKKNELQLLTVISIHELWRGLAVALKPEDQKAKIKEIMNGLTILDLDERSAKISGEIDGMLLKSGKMIDPEDCMIAGVALSRKETVLTNDGHFKRVPGLRVETY